jgi:hypothetical protein
MPAGACDRCQRTFIMESERSPQRTCPRCLRPLRMLTRGEMLRIGSGWRRWNAWSTATIFPTS